MQKTITLNKAAQLLKKSKEIYRNYSFPMITVSVNAIEAEDSELVMSKINELKNKTAEEFIKVNDARLFYFLLKQQIVEANVKTELNQVLNHLEMCKSTQNLISQMILKYNNISNFETRLSSIGSFLKVNENIDILELKSVLTSIHTEITRQDSKNSMINLFIDVKDFTLSTLKEKMEILNKKINELEDMKFEINNTQKITIDVPESLVKEFGF